MFSEISFVFLERVLLLIRVVYCFFKKGAKQEK